VTVAEREIVYWEQALWCGALATFAVLPATARPIARAAHSTPIGIQIIGPASRGAHHAAPRRSTRYSTTLRRCAADRACGGGRDRPPSYA